MDEHSAVVERWLPVVGYEGYYEVSDQGRVRSVDRIVTFRTGARRRYAARIVTGWRDSSGRRTVYLSRAGSTVPHRVYVLVLMMFVGLPPVGMEGCHENGDPSDDRRINLRWDTHGANMRDRTLHGTDPMRNRTHCPKGHLLQEPNLVPHCTTRGYRACLACRRATTGRQKAISRGDLSFDFIAVADMQFKRIMQGLPPTKKHPLHCPQGHSYSGDNLRIIASGRKKGGRVCRACERSAAEWYRLRRRPLIK